MMKSSLSGLKTIDSFGWNRQTFAPSFGFSFMKSLKTLIYVVTLFVVFYVILTRLAVPFPLVFLTFLAAQGLLLYMIWRILRDPYKTDKVFDDWYEDKEINR